MNPDRTSFASLDAPTPWWPASNNSRVVASADGRLQVQVIPSGNPDRDHRLALAVARAVNEFDAADQRPLNHIEAVREETQRALRQMGGRHAAE